MTTPHTMNPWVPITNLLDLKHLGKLGEELGELSAAVARCIIQGLDGKEPVTGKSNRLWLEEEVADVAANLQLVVDHFHLSADFIHDRATRKAELLGSWHAMLNTENVA